MPKSTDDRLKAAMGQGARVTDVVALIEELGVEIAAAQAEHDLKDAASKSVTVAEDEADALADEVAKLARKIVRLGAKRDQLHTRHEELQNSERAKARRLEAEAITARRDALAADLKARWPALCNEIVGLLDRVTASDAECGKINIESAEAVARGVGGTFYDGGQPLHRFTAMKLPSLSGRGLEEMAWPIHKNPFATMDQQVRDHALRLQKNREAEANRWRRYLVTPPEGNNSSIPIETRQGQKVLRGSPQILVMAPSQVELAEGWGCIVKLAKDNETIGLPVAATI